MECATIEDFIRDACKYGFHIRKVGNDYMCDFRCQHCNNVETVAVYPETINGRIQCTLPSYCYACRDKCKKYR
jgi:hypothetical protein